MTPTHLLAPVRDGMVDWDHAAALVLPKRPANRPVVHGDGMEPCGACTAVHDPAESESGAILAALVAAIRTGRSEWGRPT